MWAPSKLRSLATLALLSTSTVALAQDVEPGAQPQPPAERDGYFLPLTMSSRVGRQQAYVTTLSGYDSARSTPLVQGDAEVTVWGPIAIRAGAVYTQSQDTLKPSFGLHVQALRQEKHGVDASVAVLYKPEGLTEGEGEIETVLTVSRQQGRWGLFGNVVYGQDPEASERDGEVRMAALYGVAPRLHLGLDTRVRFDLGSDEGKRRAKLEADLDLVAGPTATYGIGPLVLIAQTGFSAVRVVSTQTGMVALGGIGTAF
jgi:hypothetical protein